MANKRPRLLYIDNLRTLLISLVILWHMAITYGASGFWPYQESRADELTALVFTLFGVINGPYVLGFFFMIAGYFTPGAYDRKGPWQFIQERLIRLGIPLLIYIFLIDPLIFYAIRVSAHGLTASLGGFWQFWQSHINSYSRSGLGVGPMWFVEVLLIFIIAYGLGRLVIHFARGVSEKNEPIKGMAVPSNLVIGLFAFALGVITFVMRIWLPINSHFDPLGLPTAYLPQFIALFFIGCFAYRGNWFQEIPNASGKLWLGTTLLLILVVFPLMIILSDVLEGNTAPLMGGLTWQSFVFSVWEEFICVGMIIIFLVWFREKFNRQGAVVKAMSDSTFTVYFIHPLVLVFLALVLKPIHIYPLLKWALVSLLAIIVCFTMAYFLKKLPLLRKIL